jgi:hypothetical protein
LAKSEPSDRPFSKGAREQDFAFGVSVASSEVNGALLEKKQQSGPRKGGVHAEPGTRSIRTRSATASQRPRSSRNNNKIGNTARTRGLMKGDGDRPVQTARPRGARRYCWWCLPVADTLMIVKWGRQWFIVSRHGADVRSDLMGSTTSHTHAAALVMRAALRQKAWQNRCLLVLEKDRWLGND